MSRTSIQGLVIGLSTEAKTCRKAAQVTPIYRALGSGNKLKSTFKVAREFGCSCSRVCEFPGM